MTHDWLLRCYVLEPGEVVVVEGVTMRNLNAEQKKVTEELIACFDCHNTGMIVEDVQFSYYPPEEVKVPRRAVEL